MSTEAQNITRLQGGTLVTPRGLLEADLDLQGGRILAVRPRGADQAMPEPTDIIDAAGCWVLPGAIDAHTHFGMPLGGGIASLGWRPSSEAALLGGTTTVVDFANPALGQPLAAALEQWQEAAAHDCLCDHAFHITVVDTAAERLAEIPGLVAQGLPTFKGFLAYKGRLMLEPERMKELMHAVRDAGGLLLVHAEDGQMNAEAEEILRHSGRIGPRWHPLAHPPASEVKAVEEACTMALETDCPLLVVHMSLAAGLERLEAARHRRDRAGGTTPLLGEVCLHHLLADESLYEAGHTPALGAICSPPLRAAANHHPLQRGLADGRLDLLSTDHCEFDLNTKAAGAHEGFYRVPNGCGGVAERLVLSYTRLVAGGVMFPERWVEVCCETPARVAGLGHRKGRLEAGLDADVVVFDPEPEYRWQPLGASDRTGSIWAGRPARGLVRDVWLRGHRVVAGARLVAEQPGGLFLPRKLEIL